MNSSKYIKIFATLHETLWNLFSITCDNASLHSDCDRQNVMHFSDDSFDISMVFCLKQMKLHRLQIAERCEPDKNLSRYCSFTCSERVLLSVDWYKSQCNITRCSFYFLVRMYVGNVVNMRYVYILSGKF